VAEHQRAKSEKKKKKQKKQKKKKKNKKLIALLEGHAIIPAKTA